jgi:hypothetical protein
VWEEKEENGETVYEPRPPDESQGDQIVPSTILTGGHRIKHDTSPLYLGDMTSSAGGLAYVRAVIKDVNIDSGEVVQGSGSTSVTSVWMAVVLREDVCFLREDGYGTEKICIYEPDEIYGWPRYKDRSPLEALHVALSSPLSTEVVDQIEASWYESEYVLVETACDSNVFSTTQDSFTLAFSGSVSTSDETVDELTATVSNDAFGICQEIVPLRELEPDAMDFCQTLYTVNARFSQPPSQGTVDHLFLDAESTHSFDRLTVRLEETEADTNVYKDSVGLNQVEITAASGFTEQTVDQMTLVLTSLDLGAAEVECSVEETAASSLAFSSHIEIGSPTLGYVPMTPQTAFRVGVKRWPGIPGESIPVYLLSSVDDKELKASAGASDIAQGFIPGLFVGVDAVLAVPPGAPTTASGHESYNIFDHLAALESGHQYSRLYATASKQYKEKIRQLREQGRGPSWIEMWYLSYLRDRGQIATRAYLHGWAVIGRTLASKAAVAHLKKAAGILETDMKITPKDITPLKRDEVMKCIKADRGRARKWTETLKSGEVVRYYRYDVWYFLCHGGMDPAHPFAGLPLRGGNLTPTTFGATFVHRPSLVFLNACSTWLDPGVFTKARSKELADKFNARCYVGWGTDDGYGDPRPGWVKPEVAIAAGEAFFDVLANAKLKPEDRNIDDAILEAKTKEKEWHGSTARLGHWGDANFTIDKTSAFKRWMGP